MKATEICSGWKLRCGNPGQGEQEKWYLEDMDCPAWIQATVPGDVHMDLLREGLIGEPLKGVNAEKQLWMEEKEWWYRTVFELEQIPAGKGYELVFYGLDYEALIWLNGIIIGKTTNMFIPHRFEISPYIMMGCNTLVVRLVPAVENFEGIDIDRYGGVDGEYYARRVFSRKAQFTFGWDWAPHLLTCGIWRPVELIEHDDILIRNAFVETRFIKPEWADLNIILEVENKLDRILGYNLQYSLDGAGCTRSGMLNPGAQEISFTYRLREPKLWWPLGTGESYLYNAKFGFSFPGVDICLTREIKCGIRTVELLEEPIGGEEGKSFTLVVNGEKIYCKGANWVPLDSVIGRISREQYKDRLYKAADSHLNMLRVWGGGIYEDPCFYQLCDELGIMVWQDFMFACAWYPDDNEGFMEAVKVEAESVLKQLRQHPSIVLWCGNNENDLTYHSMKTGTDPYFHRFMPVVRFYGERIYHQLLPSLCARYVPAIPYRPSSPFGGVNPNAQDEGDCHTWSVSLIEEERPERIAYRDYEKDLTKFCSEFGVMSPPCYDTLCRYLTEEERYVGSPAWKFHANRIDPDSRQQMQIIRNYWGNPEKLSLKGYSITGQILQAEILKVAWEHYRRRKFSCSGMLLWMICDSWGAPGWSVIDYYGTLKASWYYLKRIYQPVLLSFKELQENVELWVTNDRLTRLEGKILFSFTLFDGTVAMKKEIDCRIPPNASIPLEVLDKPDSALFQKGYFHAQLFKEGEMLTENRYFLDVIKNMCFPVPEIHSRLVEEEGRLELVSDVFAYCVYAGDINCELSDNFFDLYPGQVKSVYVRDIKAKDSIWFYSLKYNAKIYEEAL